MNAQLREVLEKLGHPRILVLGDLMIDRYVHGDAERISQEAPIQVLRVAFEDERLGGAGAVANNLAALGAAVDVVSIVGEDENGKKVLGYLQKIGAGTAGVRRVKGRPTTVKTRFVGRAQQRIPQQVLRVDHEDTRAIDAATEAALGAALEQALKRAAVLLISDYAKGVVTPGLCQRAIRAARRREVPVLIDPTKFTDYAKYRGATLLTPNRVETEVASGLKIAGEASLRPIAERLMKKHRLESLAITLDKEGAYVVRRGERGRMIPTRPRNVFDNAGAGDMFISVLALALASGAGLDDAVGLANVAGGIEVEKFGVQTVSREEMATDLMATSSKIRTVKQIEESVGRDRANRARVVMTNGCFDLLHHGHVEYLEFARSQGDRLVVGLNSDASVRRLKGEPRPLVPAEQRARVLAGLVAVDYVVIFEEDTPERIIRAVRPDVLVKGADWKAKDVVGAKFVEGYGGKVVLAPLVDRASTTALIEKARRARSAGHSLTSKEAAKGRNVK